jgi:glycosyltransferase involved in cell wall biosynthesis
MRILHILNDIHKFGNGIINVAIDLACFQAKDVHEVAIASAGGEYEALLTEYGVQHFHLNQTRTAPNLLRSGKHYREVIRTFQPDIVHAHMMTGVILGRVLRSGFRYRLISTVHNEFQRSSVLMGLADDVIAVSQAVAASMERRGIPKRKLHVVRNGTLGSPRTRSLDDYVAADLKRPSITTVAGMYDRKGISELIAAFTAIAPEFPAANLYLVGDGADREKFEMQAQDSDFVDRIHFEKFQPEPQCYLKSTDIFVLASHKDPSPLVIPEAREAGCAIVASSVDGIPEALDHGAAGYLVPPKSVEDLAKKLETLLSNENLLEERKQKARANLSWLSLARVHDETMTIYRESLGDGYA